MAKNMYQKRKERQKKSEENNGVNKSVINCHIHVLGKLEENIGGIRVL